MHPTSPAAVAEWPLRRQCETIARFWGLHWSAIQLVVLQEKGERDLAALKYAILRRHQRSHFLQGVDKLGIDRSLPPAVVAGRYHYFSNAIGGLAMEYVEETPRKVWIRYLPPAWSFPGQSLFAVPASVERAMFAGWHPFNGRSLGCRRLGFVVTKVFQQGEPYDEGYFEEHDRDLDDDECLRFETVTASPDFVAEAAPRLDPVDWPEERLVKARRNFALGYVEDAVLATLSAYGVHAAAALLAQATRLVAIQFTHEFRAAFGITGNGAADLVDLLQGLATLANESFVAAPEAEGLGILRSSPILAAQPVAREVYAALGEFVPMAAKVFGPRVRVTRRPHAGAGDSWLIADSAQRLF